MSVLKGAICTVLIVNTLLSVLKLFEEVDILVNFYQKSLNAYVLKILNIRI
jgi:hypothetical protein